MKDKLAELSALYPGIEIKVHTDIAGKAPGMVVWHFTDPIRHKEMMIDWHQSGQPGSVLIKEFYQRYLAAKEEA